MAETIRTNVVLDQDLVREALELTGLKTKRAVIEEALRACSRRSNDRSASASSGDSSIGKVISTP